CVRRGADAKLDVAGLHQLQHLRLLAELRTWVLVDQHRSLAQLLELVGEDVGRDAIARVPRLVVGKAVVAYLLPPSRGGPDGRGQAERDHAREFRRSEHCTLLW